MRRFDLRGLLLELEADRGEARKVISRQVGVLDETFGLAVGLELRE
jgi:hypothetical protein